MILPSQCWLACVHTKGIHEIPDFDWRHPTALNRGNAKRPTSSFCVLSGLVCLIVSEASEALYSDVLHWSNHCSGYDGVNQSINFVLLPIVAMKKVCIVAGANGTKSVVALSNIARGEPVMALAPVFSRERTRHSLQVASHRHQSFTDDVDDYINHACGSLANIKLVGNGSIFSHVAKRDISKGEEIFLNYNTCEDRMTSGFNCACGDSKCYKSISGYNGLNLEQRNDLKEDRASYLN